MSPLATAGWALALLGQRPTRWRLGWAMLGIAGVALMVLRPNAGFNPVGILAGVAGPVLMSAGVVLTQRWGRPVGVVAFVGWQLTAGGLFLLPIALIVEGGPPPLSLSAVGGYAWLGIVGTLVGYSLWFRGIDELPVASVSFLVLLSPVVATVIGWVVLGQSLTVLQTIGFVIALLAVLAAQTRSLASCSRKAIAGCAGGGSGMATTTGPALEGETGSVIAEPRTSPHRRPPTRHLAGPPNGERWSGTRRSAPLPRGLWQWAVGPMAARRRGGSLGGVHPGSCRRIGPCNKTDRY